MLNIIILILIAITFIMILSKKNIKENFSSNSTIPKIIIQTWKDNSIPEKYYNEVKSVKEKNPGYEFKFFTDEDIETFLKSTYPDYYETYKKLPIKIQKIDFFRYIAVYHYGGFYFDLDMECLKPLDDLLQYESVFPLDMHITQKRCVENSSRYDEFCKKDVKFLVGQYAFAAKPKHEFIKLLIDNIHEHIDVIVKNKNNTHLYVYRTTGPDYVTMNYLDYNGVEKIYVLEHPEGQYFGDYAVHKYYGTWK